MTKIGDLERKIDLRSDTVTQPCTAMRKAIAEAEVGDDMYGEDPTVNLLEKTTAELLGKPAAIYTPTGTMANQIAIKIQTQPGDGVMVGMDAHNWMFEGGAAGFISSVQISVLPGNGTFSTAAMQAAFRPNNSYFAPTTLVSVENTHNVGGGLVWEQGQVQAVLATARKLGMATHLDGARLWNAATRTGLSLKELAAGFDTVSVCLSKGLGAPVGSLLCASEGLIVKARRIRRILGGSMRQAGIMAAGGLYAIRHNRPRIQEDHDNATLLATGLDKLPGLSVNCDLVHSNLIMVDVEEGLDAHELQKQAATRGVLFLAANAKRFRMVTHMNVSREDCVRAVEAVADSLPAKV